jgi:hypothetical protein
MYSTSNTRHGIKFATEFLSSATRDFAGRIAFTRSLSFRGHFELRELALSDLRYRWFQSFVSAV